MRTIESLKWFKHTPLYLLINNLFFASYISLSYKQMLSVSGWWLLQLNKEFVFTDPKPPIINIL